MHLSKVCQLAPADDGGRKAGRHRDRIVTNGHGLPGRYKSDNGGVRPIVFPSLQPTLVWSPYESGVEGGRRRSEIDRISVKAHSP